MRERRQFAHPLSQLLTRSRARSRVPTHWGKRRLVPLATMHLGCGRSRVVAFSARAAESVRLRLFPRRALLGECPP